MIWWQNTFNMHLSCKWTWWAFSGMYSTYVLLQADSACKNVHELVHDVVPQKRYVLQGTYLFGSFVIFKMVCPSSVFQSVWPLSVVQWTHSTWNSFMHLHVFHAHVKFYDRVRDRIKQSHAQSYERSFWAVQGSNPWPCTQSIFVGPGFEPLPMQHDLFMGRGFDSLALIACFKPSVSLAYVTRPHKCSKRWHCRTKKLLLVVKSLSAWLVALAVWGSRKVSTCD